MLVIYSVGNVLIIILFLSTVTYRKKFRKKLNKKQHRLWWIYGLAMFLTDRLPEKIGKNNKKLSKAMGVLYVKDNAGKEQYLYTVKKVAFSLLIVWITLLTGLCAGIYENISGAQYIKSLTRDKSNTTQYEIVAQNEDGEKETVHVDVSKKELTVDEIYKILENNKKVLLKTVLAKNKDAGHVDSPLNLVNSIGEDDIDVYWNISDDSILNYDGKISENIPKEGTIINITATMMLNDVSVDYVFPVNIFPMKEEENLQEKIQKHVDENDKYSKEVKLPVWVDGHMMKYYEKLSPESNVIILFGIVLAIALFFLKDLDIKKEVEERNYQLLRDYPEIASKILLYYEAGLSVSSGFEKMVEEYKKEKGAGKKIFRYAYEELEVALIKMKSGVSEITAVREYGNRCGLHCYIKWANIIEQNLKRGTKELTYALRNEVDNALFERKSNALKEGEKISTKLLGPMVLMLIISIALVIVPAFMSMNL